MIFLSKTLIKKTTETLNKIFQFLQLLHFLNALIVQLVCYLISQISKLPFR